MALEFKRFGGYRLGSNIPLGKGAPWEAVARVSRWGAPVIELNTNAERLGSLGLEAIKQQGKANDLVYTWHVPPSKDESGELALPNSPNQNEFARAIMARAIKAAAEVGARHITFHATNSVPRPEKDQVYVYNTQTNQVSVQRIIPGTDPKKTVEILNESSKAQFRTQLNRMEAQKRLVDNLEKTAETIAKQGVNEMNALQIAGLVGQVTNYSSMVGLQPQNTPEWIRIQNKAIRQEPLTQHEKQVIEDYSKKVRQQLKDYKKLFENQLKQLEPYKDKDMILDGLEVMRRNVAENIAKIDKNALKLAVDKGITLGFENLPAHMIFNTPEELNDLRKKTVEALVKKKVLTREQAEKLIGFTFDTAHANTTKYIEINGKKYASPSEFLKALKGPVYHVHAVDSVGIVDSHLPLGQGEITHEEMEKIEEALKKSGFKGAAIHELGSSQLPVLYGSSAEWFEGGNYMIGGQPTASFWGPSYLSAAMTDPLMLGKDRGYFNESFADIF